MVTPILLATLLGGIAHIASRRLGVFVVTLALGFGLGVMIATAGGELFRRDVADLPIPLVKHDWGGGPQYFHPVSDGVAYFIRDDKHGIPYAKMGTIPAEDVSFWIVDEEDAGNLLPTTSECGIGWWSPFVICMARTESYEITVPAGSWDS